MYISSGNIENNFLDELGELEGKDDNDIIPKYLDFPQRLVLNTDKNNNNNKGNTNSNIMDLVDFFIF